MTGATQPLGKHNESVWQEPLNLWGNTMILLGRSHTPLWGNAKDSGVTPAWLLESRVPGKESGVTPAWLLESRVGKNGESVWWKHTPFGKAQ